MLDFWIFRSFGRADEPDGGWYAGGQCVSEGVDGGGGALVSVVAEGDAAPVRRRLSRSPWAAVGVAVAVSVGGGGLLTASAAPATDDPSSTVTIVPCRLLDTRQSTGERTAPIGDGETVTLQAFGTNGDCTITDVRNRGRNGVGVQEGLYSGQ